jgi:hypothetical protein
LLSTVDVSERLRMLSFGMQVLCALAVVNFPNRARTPRKLMLAQQRKKTTVQKSASSISDIIERLQRC